MEKNNYEFIGKALYLNKQKILSNLEKNHNKWENEK